MILLHFCAWSRRFHSVRHVHHRCTDGSEVFNLADKIVHVEADILDRTISLHAIDKYVPRHEATKNNISVLSSQSKGQVQNKKYKRPEAVL